MVSEKQVIDEVSGWLRVFDDGTVDRTWTGPPEALFLMGSVPPYDTPVDGVTVHDIVSSDTNLRIYIPETESDAAAGANNIKHLPVLLQFHGGGFCISHATWFMYHAFYSRLARSLPAIVVSPFLPLAPEHRLPAAIDASFSSLLFLRSLARNEYSTYSDNGTAPAIRKLRTAADFSRIFLIGDSSGGNLVHQIAARACRELEFSSLFKVSGAIPIHPGFVRSKRSKSELEQTPDPFLTLDMLDKFLAYGLPEGATKDHPITCPMGDMAPPLEGVELPPYLVAVAERDLIKDTNDEFCEAMKKAGKEIEVVVNEGVGHSFYLNTFAVLNDPVTGKRTEELVLAIKDFVERH